MLGLRLISEKRLKEEIKRASKLQKSVTELESDYVCLQQLLRIWHRNIEEAKEEYYKTLEKVSGLKPLKLIERSKRK